MNISTKKKNDPSEMIAERNTEFFLNAVRYQDLKSVQDYLQRRMSTFPIQKAAEDTALSHAINCNNEKMLELLLKAGFKVPRDPVTGQAGTHSTRFSTTNLVLQACIIYGTPTMLDIVLTHGQDLDVEEFDCNGKTALHRATERGDLQIIKKIIEQGARVDVKTAAGQTLLELAGLHHAKDSEVVCYLEKIILSDLERTQLQSITQIVMQSSEARPDVLESDRKNKTRAL